MNEQHPQLGPNQVLTQPTRADLLFSPIATMTEDALDFDFSGLLAGNPGATVEDAAVREDKNIRNKVTTESEMDAILCLNNFIIRDEQAEKIIDEYKEKQGRELSSRDLVASIRTDVNLRKPLGIYLAEKLEDMVKTPHIMPDRINRNTQKSTNAKGYEDLNLTSHEYTALLAISMIDGTFKKSAAEPEDYNPQKDSGGGQHRYAARQLLFTRQ